jgi:putative transposase
MGRKRHLLVDTEGFVLKVVVHPANLHDRFGAKLVLGALGTAFPRLRHIWADQGYAGVLGEWSREELGIDLEVVYPWWRQLQRYAPKVLEAVGYRAGFHVLPRRWVVERSIAWLNRSRRLCKDYERWPATSEALVYLAGIRLLLARLTRL